jgi:hypothetical protein
VILAVGPILTGVLASLGRSEAAPGVDRGCRKPDRVAGDGVREQSQGRRDGQAEHGERAQCESLTSVHRHQR